MSFVDEAVIDVVAGKGGNGAVSFRRERSEPKGGPDGGDGGDGASIVMQVDMNLNTLVDYKYQPIYRATSAGHGMGRNKTGRSGEDIVLKVPPGTIVQQYVKETDTWFKLGELLQEQQQLLVASGGKGGRGNRSFRSSVNRTPRQNTPGEMGVAHKLKLELRLLADVGLMGMPNVGKSSLVSAMTGADLKIADYPFTTLSPSLGVVQLEQDEPFVMADLPGLVRGAGQGVGLGFRFLRHLSRNKLILHLVPADLSIEQAVDSVNLLELELEDYDKRLKNIPRALLLSKIDLADEDKLIKLKSTLVANTVYQDVLQVSVKTKQGLEQLKQVLHARLQDLSHSTQSDFMASVVADSKDDLLQKVLAESKNKGE